MNHDQRQPASKSGSPTLSWSSPLVLIGIALIAGLGVVLAYLIQHSTTTETQWSRLIYLYGGVESLVFAAVGALFGTTVQRGQTVAAQNQAKESQEHASRNQAGANKAQALEAEIRSKARMEGLSPGDFGNGGLSSERIGELSSDRGADSPFLHLLLFVEELNREER